MIQQSAKAVVMIRPFRFYPNPETASDNAFQREAAATDADTISKAAQRRVRSGGGITARRRRDGSRF